jgi:glycosyltransferase involved in cell wall biosynthesis
MSIAPELSVVIPVFNNASTLRELHARLTKVLAEIGTAEILFVDDGSSDESAEVVAELGKNDPVVRLIRLSRNFGQQAALTAGLDFSCGRAVVMMDADLQDPPERITDLVERWRQGCEVVYMVRANRKEGLLKRLSYAAFYRFFRLLAEVDMPMHSGDFSLLDRQVVATLKRMPERTRFLRGLRNWSGFRQASLVYDRPPRPSGKSQYTVGRLVQLAMDGLLAFSTVPLRLAAFAGIISGLIGFALLVLIGVERLTATSSPAAWLSSIAVTLLIGGAQLLAIGIVGAYIGRIYTEVKGRPVYAVYDDDSVDENGA